jgi:hypothetical protein
MWYTQEAVLNASATHSIRISIYVASNLSTSAGFVDGVMVYEKTHSVTVQHQVKGFFINDTTIDDLTIPANSILSIYIERTSGGGSVCIYRANNIKLDFDEI